MRVAIHTLVLFGTSLFLGSCAPRIGGETCDEPMGNCCLDPNSVCAQTMMSGGLSLGTFRQADHSMRPALAVGADFRAVTVSAVDNYLESSTGTVGDIWIQERILDPNFMGCAPDPIGGGHVCGIQLFKPTQIPTGSHSLIGDVVTVEGGTYEEFNCPTCSSQFPNGRTLPEFGTPTVQRIGSTAAPAPVQVRFADLVAGGDAYVGVVVEITDDITVGAQSGTRGEYPIDIVPATGAGFTLSPQIGPLNDPNTGMPLAAGTVLHRLRGVATYFYAGLILPRTPDDLR